MRGIGNQKTLKAIQNLNLSLLTPKALLMLPCEPVFIRLAGHCFLLGVFYGGYVA